MILVTFMIVFTVMIVFTFMIVFTVMIAITTMIALFVLIAATNPTGDVLAIDPRITVVVNAVGTDFVFTGIGQVVAIITVGGTTFTTARVETVVITVGTAYGHTAGLFVSKIHQAVTVVVDTVVADFLGVGVDVAIAVATIPGTTATTFFRKAIVIAIRTLIR